ncbi:phage virion morphogenesis protein [Cupriavidus gilardii]|uniref:phage virion morphogenesis protein n=1 Tax=Cupriavidus gilardii TaxID=82541 RepID=UPI003D7669EE
MRCSPRLPTSGRAPVRYTTNGSKTKIPARPFLRLTPTDEQEIERTVGSYLATIFG